MIFVNLWTNCHKELSHGWRSGVRLLPYQPTEPSCKINVLMEKMTSDSFDAISTFEERVADSRKDRKLDIVA